MQGNDYEWNKVLSDIDTKFWISNIVNTEDLYDFLMLLLDR